MVSAWGFCVYRRKRQYMGAGLLGFGFTFWGAYLMAFPFLQGSPGETAAAAGFFISSVLQLFIAVSMIILVLEQMRFAGQRRNLQEIRSCKVGFLPRKNGIGACSNGPPRPS